MEEEEEEQREGKSKGPDFRWEQRVAHAGARGRTKQNGIQGNIPYFHILQYLNITLKKFHSYTFLNELL